MGPDYAVVQQRIDEIEAELKRIGLWRNTPLDSPQYAFTKAFGMDTMSFSQWLQFIFIPRVREIVAQRGQFPSQSQVGAQAVREFDGYSEADHLVWLLNQFDALFDQPSAPHADHD